MFKIQVGDCLDLLRTTPSASINCCVTSPPYWSLRDYGHTGQIGLEPTLEEYISKLVEVFREVNRVLRADGTLWLNLGDAYNAYNSNRGPSTSISDGTTGRDHPKHRKGLTTKTLKNKDLIGIPWRVAFALQADGWYLRQDIIWHKPNPMPESVRGRCTKAHEYLFLLTKSARYNFDSNAMKEPAANGQTRNRRSVWSVPTRSSKGAHFATFPPDLIKPCILAGCPASGTVLDPFNGSGTTGEVTLTLERNYIGMELNPKYAAMTEERLNNLPAKLIKEQ